MKVIDLLNKIANGEEVPNKLKIKKWEYNSEDMDLEYELFERLLEGDADLNDEVEIIEEEKKIPEKLIPTSLKGIDNLDEKIEIAHIDTVSVIDTVNEIIDYLKSKGDE